MKTFICVLALALIGTAAAQSAQECQERLANIIINMNGDFFNKDQIIRVLEDMGTMYLQGQSLEDIARYLKNSQALYCTSEQMNKIADLTSQLKNIIGSAERTADLMNMSFTEGMSFINKDQSELDALISKERGDGVDTDTLKRDLCRFIVTKYTPEKRFEMARRILGFITPEHREQIRSLLSTVMKLDDIDINNVGTTPPGFVGY